MADQRSDLPSQISTSDDTEVWDLSEDPDEIVAASLDLEREWSSRQAHFHTLGYRDGIEAGKNSSVQEGFEAGFSEAVDAGFRCGLTRGWTSAFTALPELVQKSLLDDIVRLQVTQSHEALSSFSSDKALHLFNEDINKMEMCKSEAETSSKMSANSLVIVKDCSKEGTSSDSELVPDLPISNKVENLHVELQSALKSARIIF